MSNLKTLISEMFKEKLNESAKITNNEALKIGSLAEKEAAKIRKEGGPLADEDAEYMENLADYSFKRDFKRMSKTMNKGETENRETAFEIVSSVIGKERATALAKGN